MEFNSFNGWYCGSCIRVCCCLSRFHVIFIYYKHNKQFANSPKTNKTSTNFVYQFSRSTQRLFVAAQKKKRVLLIRWYFLGFSRDLLTLFSKFFRGERLRRRNAVNTKNEAKRHVKNSQYDSRDVQIMGKFGSLKSSGYTPRKLRFNAQTFS